MMPRGRLGGCAGSGAESSDHSEDSACARHTTTIMSSSEQADIDRILKERGKGARKQYLCSWMDDAEPQWVAAKYLADTVALEEWEEVCAQSA